MQTIKQKAQNFEHMMEGYTNPDDESNDVKMSFNFGYEEVL